MRYVSGIVKKVVLVMLLAAGIASFYVYRVVFGKSIVTDFELFIPTGSSYEDVQSLLIDSHVLSNVSHFDWVAQKMNYPNHIYGGRYVLKEGMSNRELVQMLRGGLQTPVKIVLNNVNFKTDLAKRLSAQLEIDSADFMQWITDTIQLTALSVNADNVMCRFIPNTYEMYWNVSLETCVERFFSEYDAFWTSDRLEKAGQLNLDPDEVIVLASIVEKEYKYATEREKIAGVYVNRIELRMKLQADPTVKYALGDLSIQRVLKVHTEYDHPYNTYFYAGLPPGPICLPETSTIDAVLNAEDHNFLYFCAKADLSGYHEFNTTLNDHLADAKLYQQALNKLNIY